MMRDNMKARAAEELIEKTFSNKFDLENFKGFLIELFNRYDKEETYEDIPNQYNEYVKNIISLGSYTEDDDSSSSIVFYAIELKSSSIHRARTMQRNLIGNFLKKRTKKAALVAFFNSSTQDWRFSYVKRSLKMKDGSLNEQLSAPERHSFLVGPNEPNHTCKTQFKKLIQNENDITISDIENAFKIENVSEEFYEEYRKLYDDIKKSLEKNIDNDPKIKAEFEDKNIKSKDFAKKLMGQLVFIYFLQKKGLLGVEKNSNWGSGPKNFLKEIFDNKEDLVKNYKNFFNDILEPLFYEGLSVDTSDYHYAKFGYKVPFLNGGLFDPINGYDWRDTEIYIDDQIFKKIIETFDQFNFTVKEDGPLEQEVAIDLEMLGKFFQNLFEEDEKKNKGVYFTPSYIVHYICQEVLINYLSINSKVPKEDLKKFIRDGDILIDSLINNFEEDDEEYLTKNRFFNSIKNNSKDLYSLLSKVKIIDPAVGSGALLLTMMNEIVKAKHILFLLNGNKNIDFYELKKETIENSLYGVDIDLSAIEITKLRFCLSLIVEEENNNYIRPLPNLDNKIKKGNSLVDSFDEIGFFDKKVISKSLQTRFPITNPERAFNELEFKKQEYFKTSGFTSKNILKNDIKELKWNFIESHLMNHEKENITTYMNEYFENKAQFFIWELEFSEVFKGEDPGFDIVIGHPPFGTELPFGIKFEDEEYNFLKGKYIKQERKPQKVIYFIELAYDKLLKNNGELCYIIPKPFNYVSQYIPIRQYIIDNIETVIDCGEAWENVKGEQIILMVNKSQKFDNYYNGSMAREYSEINLEELNKDYINEFEMVLNCVNNKEINLARKIRKSNRFLESVTKNKKGPNIQKNMCPNEKFELIGGNEIQREGIVAIKGKIAKEHIREPSIIKDNSVLVQDILSLGKNQVLKITASIPNTNDLYICNTIDQIIIENFTNFSNYFFWALFNSKLINWYCHKFIFANAIRDMHFNSSVTNKIPLPSLDDEESINTITNTSKELYKHYQKLFYLREPMFDCLRNNFEIKEDIKNFEYLNHSEFIDKLEEEQNITIKKDNKNFKKFFNKIKNSCLEKNEKISSLETESNESKEKLHQELGLLKEQLFDYLRSEFIHKIKTTTDGKIKNFEVLDYNDFIEEISKQNVNTDNINNLNEFFNNIKNSCSEIKEEIVVLEEELNSKIYDLYGLKRNEKKIIDDYYSGENIN